MSAESRSEPGQRLLNLPTFQERQSLRHQVAHALRASLVTGEMRPGVLYSAPTLAEEFGVSATPVREAMLDLANEGLVVAIRNKGFRVTELSEQDLDHITQVRQLIEVPTVAHIAQTRSAATAVEIEALRPLARRIEALAVAPDLVAYVEADRQFHLQLLALAGNDQLVEVVGNLRSRSRLYGLRGLAERNELEQSASEHEAILDLILSGQTEGVADLMRQHIGHVRGVWAHNEVPIARQIET